jgi:hypothetical protein
MQNIKAVRKLLLNPGNIVDERHDEILESVFDYLMEEGNGNPEHKIKSLMFDLIQAKRAENLGTSRMQLHLISPEAVANVVKAIAYCFPDEFQLIPEIVLLDFRVYNSAPTIYNEEAGAHAMIIVTLLGLADDEAFDMSDSKFDKPLMALLKEGLQKRYFRSSIIYSHQVSLLSSAMKVFMDRACAMTSLSYSFRWVELCKTLVVVSSIFSGDEKTQPGDASLEYALVNELCFKIFNTRSLKEKVLMLERIFSSR